MFECLHKLKDFLIKYKKNNLLAIFFLLISYFTTFYKPYITGKVADFIIYQNMSTDDFLFQVLLFLFFIVITYFINIGWSFNLFKNVHLISRDARNKLMEKYLAQFPKFFEKNTTGSLMGKATNDIDALSEVVGYGIMCIIDAILYPIVLLIVMAFISWQLTLVAIILFPPFILLLYKINMILEEKFRRLQESFDEMNDITLESVSSIKVIKAFNAEDVFMNRFMEKVENNSSVDMEKNKIQQIYMPLSNLLTVILTTITLIGGLLLISDSKLTIGSLITYMMFLGNLNWPAFALSDFFTVGEQGKASLKRIEEILNYEEDIKDIENPVTIDNPETFSFVNYNFRYPSSDRDILKDINLDFKSGDTIILVGKTGSGKTTLLKQFLKFYDKTSGDLLINDIPIENLKREDFIRKIAYVPQENYLFSKSIRENITFFRDFDEADIMAAVNASDLKKDLDSFNDGLETLTGERGVALSGGQRQRIALARALIGDSDILILDDVFSAVDTRTEKNIIENLNRYRAGKTNIIATHRLSVIKPDDTVVVLENGEIAAKGTHEEVYKTSKWYKEQYDLQSVEVKNE